MAPALFLTIALLPVTAAERLTRAGVVNYAEFLEFFGTERLDAFKSNVSHAERERLFEATRQQVMEHNAKPDKRWWAVVNEMSDYTDQEKRRLLGLKRRVRWSPVPSSMLQTTESSNSSGDGHGVQGNGTFDNFLNYYQGALSAARSLLYSGNSTHRSPASSSVLQMAESGDDAPRRGGMELAKTVDWRHQLGSAQRILSQGACGSCWAVASIGALETHAEIRGIGDFRASISEVVECAPNEYHCGGDGGCSGSTAELAFAYIRDAGLTSDGAFEKTGKLCFNAHQPRPEITANFKTLAFNEGEPLAQAVVQEGPVVVSMDGGHFGNYGGGVFDGCPKDAIVNHAVLLVGYGVAPPAEGRTTSDKYWTIRNSWGKGWGNHGFMDILRHDNDNDWCGTDADPQVGVFCAKDSPVDETHRGWAQTTWVCGMCGILSDSVVPRNVEWRGMSPQPETAKVSSSPGPTFPDTLLHPQKFNLRAKTGTQPQAANRDVTPVNGTL